MRFVVDDHEIAWAAGFFEAEGTACSSQRRDRPSRERSMALYQGGRAAIPDALLRFQRAVGGRGNITGPYRDRLFHWSTKKNTAFDEVMALMLALAHRVEACATSECDRDGGQEDASRMRGPSRRSADAALC